MAYHALHVRGKGWVRSCAPNVHGDTARPETRDSRQAAADATQIGHYLEIKFVVRTDGACAGNGSKRWDYQYQIVEAGAFGRMPDVRTQVLDVCVAPGLYAGERGER